LPFATGLFQTGRGMLVANAQGARWEIRGGLCGDRSKGPVIEQEAAPLRRQFGDRLPRIIESSVSSRSCYEAEQPNSQPPRAKYYRTILSSDGAPPKFTRACNFG